jgi:hypothetical protein
MVDFKNIENNKVEIDKMNNITKIISGVRLILGITFVVFLIILFSTGDYIVYGIISGVLFLALILFILFTNKFYKKLDSLKRIEQAYKFHNMRRNFKYMQFQDTGNDLKNKEDYKLADLDIFGKHSIYQYLSVCKTKYGRENLANRLKFGSDDVKSKYSASFLAETEDKVKLDASFLGFEASAKTLDSDVITNAFSHKIEFNYSFLIPLLSFIGTLVYLVLIFTNNLNPYLLFAFGFVNYILCKLFLVNEIFNLDSTGYYNLFESYIDVINTLNEIEIKDDNLNEIKSNLNDNLINLKKSISLLNLLSTRKNIIFNFITNFVCIFDFFIIFIYNFKTKNYANLKDVFENVGKLEAISSLANMGFDNNYYAIPEEGDNIEGIDMYHPLVKECIPNSFKLDGGVILTGSNMSGKTTFMRTIGLCQILANAQGLVPAIVFKTNKFEVLTSLRANDMLAEGISTFYAEILRMKKINQAIKENKCLILVDEIFKGTNTNDRVNAASEVIKKLNNYNQLFIISTHDFELCELNNITNYHFNESYINDKIDFDYKIKEGKSDTKNAIYLLKIADII